MSIETTAQAARRADTPLDSGWGYETEEEITQVAAPTNTSSDEVMRFPAWRYAEAADNVATVDRAVMATMEAASLLVRTGVRLIYPVPYAGDEQPTTYVRPAVDEFWLTKPA